MSCNQKSELHITSTPGGFLLRRCCFSRGKFISEEDFFKKTVNELANYEVYPSDIDSILQCNHDCDFKDFADTLVLDAIHNCNLRCYNCCIFTKDNQEYMKQHPEIIPHNKELFFKTLEYFKNSEITKVVIDNSGEVFLYYKELINFLKSITKSQYEQIVFATNATLLNKEKIDELHNLSEQTGVTYSFVVSVDGTTKKVFEAVRPGAIFEKVIENIALLKQYFFVSVTYTIKKPNVKDAKNIDEFFHKIGIEKYQVQADFFHPAFSRLLTDKQKCK